MIKSNQIIADARTSAWSIAIVLVALAGTAFAGNINLDMEGSTAVIPKGSTLNRNLNGIPVGIPGKVYLKLKWHVVTDVTSSSLTFNELNVQVRHGDTVVKTNNCYSIHANKIPKCDIMVNVSLDEANNVGEWNLKLINNSNYNVTGFDIEKGKDTSPLVPNFKSVYTPRCLGAVKLTMENMTSPLRRGETRFFKIYGIGKAPGVLQLKAKWHVINKATLAAPIYNYLKIELIAPNGQLMVSIVPDWKIYASIHAVGKYPKLDVEGTIWQQYANLPGDWKLKITNNSDYDVTGFNIEKESGAMDGSVPRFSSSFKATCSF